MDHIENFRNILEEAIAGLESDIYTKLLMDCAEGMDADVYKPTQMFFSALNRRGVSSKTIFEAMMDVGRELKRDE